MIRLIITALVVRASMSVNDHKISNNELSHVKEAVRRVTSLPWWREESPRLSSAKKQNHRKGKSPRIGLRNPQEDTTSSTDNELDKGLQDSLQSADYKSKLDQDPKSLWRLWKSVEKVGRLIAEKVIENPTPTLKDPESHQVSVIYALVEIGLKLARTCSASMYISKYPSIVGAGLMEGFEHPQVVAKRLIELLDFLDTKTERIEIANSENFVEPDYEDENEDGNKDEDEAEDDEENNSDCSCEDSSKVSPQYSWFPWTGVFEIIIRLKQVNDGSGSYVINNSANNCQNQKSSNCDQNEDVDPSEENPMVKRHGKRGKGRVRKAMPIAKALYKRTAPARTRRSQCCKCCNCCGKKSELQHPPNDTDQLPPKPKPKRFLSPKERKLQFAVINLAIRILLSEDLIKATKNYDEVQYLLSAKETPINIFELVHAGATVLQFFSDEVPCNLTTVTLKDVELQMRPTGETPIQEDNSENINQDATPVSLDVVHEAPANESLDVGDEGASVDLDVGSEDTEFDGPDSAFGDLDTVDQGLASDDLNAGSGGQDAASIDINATYGDLDTFVQGSESGDLSMDSGGVNEAFGDLDMTFGGPDLAYGDIDAGVQGSATGDLDADSGGLDVAPEDLDMGSSADGTEEEDIYANIDSLGLAYGGQEAEYEGPDTQVGGEDVVYEGVDTQLEGKDAVYEGVDTQLEGQDAVYGGVDTQLEGQDAVYGGVDTQLEGQDTVYGGVDTQLEGQDTVYGGVDTQLEGQDTVYGGVDTQLEGQDAVYGGVDTQLGVQGTSSGDIGSQTGNQGTSSGNFDINGGIGSQTGQGMSSADMGSQTGNQGTAPGGFGLNSGKGSQAGGQGSSSGGLGIKAGKGRGSKSADSRLKAKGSGKGWTFGGLGWAADSDKASGEYDESDESYDSDTADVRDDTSTSKPSWKKWLSW